MSDDYTRLRGQAEWSLKIDHVPAALEIARSILAALDEISALKAELTELRALRDRLIAIPRGPNQAVWFDDILALIASAEALAATKEV